MLESFSDLSTSIGFNSAWILLLLPWVLAWKGVALWKAARNGQKKWFIALLIINTMAVLEIVYIIFFSKPKQK